MKNPLAQIPWRMKSFRFDKKLLIWLIKLSSVFFIFFIFVFPAQREANIVSADLSSMKNQISEMKIISINLLTAEELKETENRVDDFETKLLDASKAGALLDFITNEAEKNHFNVIQMYSDSPIAVKDEAGRDLEFKGKKLFWLPVNFRVETDFKSLGNFLKSIKEESKGNFLLESLILEKTAAQSESLQCDITLSFVAK